MQHKQSRILLVLNVVLNVNNTVITTIYRYAFIQQSTQWVSDTKRYICSNVTKLFTHQTYQQPKFYAIKDFNKNIRYHFKYIKVINVANLNRLQVGQLRLQCRTNPSVNLNYQQFSFITNSFVSVFKQSLQLFQYWLDADNFSTKISTSIT